jgi:hypothetical protein
MKTPTLRQLFLTESPFPRNDDDPLNMEPEGFDEEIPDPEFDGFEETEFEPAGPVDVAIEALPMMGDEDCEAPQEDFMPFGTLAPLAGFDDDEVDEFGEPQEKIRGAAAEEVDDFEEGPSARTAGSGRAFEGLDPRKRYLKEAAANDYAHRQVKGALERRGAQVSVSEDGLTIQGTFTDPNSAETAWIALGTKYPKDGPNAVTATRKGNTLTFTFVEASGTPKVENVERFNEADATTPPVSVEEAIQAISVARKNYAQAGRFTPFSNWYKGEHGRDYAALKRAVKNLVVVAKKGVAADAALANSAKEYYNSLLVKDSRSSIYDEALSLWKQAKAETPGTPKVENVGFDRFMDRILIQESVSVQRPPSPDSRQRIRAAKHQERPLGRIRYGVK